MDHLPDHRPELDLLTYAAALANGATRWQWRHALRTGKRVRLRRGVSSSDASDLSRLAAALLTIEGAVVSHQTAAGVLGLPVVGQAPLTVTVPKQPRRTPALAGDVRVLVAALPTWQVIECSGLRITSAARTAVDVARAGRLRDGVMAMDVALRLGMTDLAELRSVVRAQRGWPGSRAAVTAVRLADPRRESPLESFGAAVWKEHELAVGTPQVRIHDEAGFIGRVDECWPQQQTVAEADGLLKYDDRYDAPPSDTLRAEKLRQERLERSGLAVVRYTWRDLWDDPRGTAMRLREAFQRGPTLPRRFRADPASPLGWREIGPEVSDLPWF